MPPVVKVLESKRGSAEALDAFYQANFIPIHMVATAQGCSDIDTLAYIAQSEDLPIRCCAGTDEELRATLTDLERCTEIVLDITALMAVKWLRLEECLASRRLVISHGTKQQVRSHIDDLRRNGPRRAWHSPSPGLVRESRESANAYDVESARWEKFWDWVNSRCVAVDCPELANVDAPTRDEWIESLGLPAAQSIALAAKPGRLLWTDDHAVFMLGSGELHIPRTWTQPLAMVQCATGEIGAEIATEITARLLGMRYVATRYDTDVVVKSAALARWNPMEFPLKQTLDQIIPVRGDLVPAAAFVLRSLVALCGAAELAQTRHVLTIAVLERLAKHPNGVLLIQSLIRVLPTAFRLNVVRAMEVTNTIRAWLRSRATGALVGQGGA